MHIQELEFDAYFRLRYEGDFSLPLDIGWPHGVSLLSPRDWLWMPDVFSPESRGGRMHFGDVGRTYTVKVFPPNKVFASLKYVCSDAQFSILRIR